MEFSNIDTCQDEIEKANEALKYFKEKESLMSLVYDSFGTTIKQSDDACRMLRDMNTLIEQTRLHFKYLTDPKTGTVAPNFVAKAPESSIVNQPVAKVELVASIRDSTRNCNIKDKPLAVCRASNTQPKQTEQQPRLLSRDPRMSMRPSGHQISAQRQSIARRGSMAPIAAPRQSRIGRPSMVSRRHSIRHSLGSKTGTESQKADVPPVVQHRIKHNRDYPRPWLDPPPPRRQRPSLQAPMRSAASEYRRTSLRQRPSQQPETTTRRVSISRPIKVDTIPNRRGTLVPARRVSLVPSFQRQVHTDLIKRTHTLSSQPRAPAASRHAQPSRLERVQED